MCAVQEVAKGGFPFPSMFRALSAQGLSPQVSITEQQLVPVALPKPPVVPNTLGRKYESPLVVFRSYRYQVLTSIKDKSSLRSSAVEGLLGLLFQKFPFCVT